MRKKLLFVTHQLSRTGAPIVFLDMIRIFRDEGHEINVISLLDGPLCKELEAMGIPVSIKDDFFHDREAFRPYAEGFDAVFCNTLITYQVIHVLNGSSTPVFWWIHEGEQYFEYFKTVLPDLSKLSGNIKVLSVGHYVQDVIRRRYGIETGILHFGIKDSFNGGAGAKRSTGKEDRVRFVISGTYSKVKGQDILCAAIRDLPTEIRNRCEFIFCGNEENVDDEVFSAVEKLVRDHDNVKKYALLPREKMIEMMGTMDFLIVPSRVETVSAVAAEAMMMRKPCIITDTCGIAHYLKDKENALLCRAEDKKGLCEKIAEAVRLSEDSTKYERMAEAAREVYDKHFSDKVIKPKVLSLLSEPEKKEKLIFTVGVYDILDIFTYEMIPEFERLGYEVFLFDSSDMVHTLGKLYDFVKTPVKACITFNNLAFNTELTPGRNMWDDLGIPIINILTDHPFCHKKALDNAPKNAIVLCPDLNHMRYLERFYPGIATVGFLPHGGKLLQREPKPIKERQIDIIYAEGISRKFAVQMMPDFKNYPYDAKDIADKAYEMMVKDPSITTEEAIEIEVKKHGVVLSDDELCSLIEELHYVDLLIVSHYREKVVRTLAEAGLSIALYGTGWDVCDWIHDCPTLDFRGRVSADEIVELMHESKIVLSTMTWFKDGTHDRVYNGMLAGAVAVTDTSLYMKENYNYYPDNSAELVMFELNETDRLPALIKGLLADTDRMQIIADNGRKRALNTDTWAARADELHRDLLTQL